LKLPPQFVLLLGALGIGLMLSVLREIEIKEHTKQIVLITGSLGEIATLLGLTGYDLYLTFGLGKKFFVHLLWIAFFGVAFVVLLKVIKFLIWYFPEKVAALIESENKAAVDVRASFALMLLFMSFTSLVHIEPILGAFIAGTLLGFIFREKEAFEGKLSALGYGFLIPFFFVQVGFHFDASTLGDPAVLKLAVVLWTALFAVKALSTVWFFFLRFSFREVLLAALLFSFPFTILIAVGKILYEKGVWDASQLSLVILLTVLTSVFYPMAVKVLFSSRRERG